MVSVLTTTSCMACTSTVSNETTSGGNITMVTDVPKHRTNPTENMFQDYYIKYYNCPSRGRNCDTIITIDGSHGSQYQKMKFRQNIPSNRFNRGKPNKMNRTHGNIHQPGRTNCTQRFQTK